MDDNLGFGEFDFSGFDIVEPVFYESVKEYLNFEEHIKLPLKERIVNLLEYWGFEKNVFYGKVVETINDEKGFTFLRELRNINGKIVSNPFQDGTVEAIFCVTYKLPKNLNATVGDVVMFSIEVNKDDVTKFIKVKESSVKKLKKLENIDKISEQIDGENLEFDEDVINEINNKFLKTNSLVRVYVEDSFKDIAASAIKDVQSQKDVLGKSISDLKNQLDIEQENFNNEKKFLEQEKESIATNIETLKTQYKNIEDSIEHVESKRRNYVKLGLLDDVNRAIPKRNKKKNGNKQKINHVYDYLRRREENPLLYSKEIIEQFFVGLKTNQIIILGGAPGSGKTSLVEGMAEAIGARCNIVSVRPNWNSVEDLIGYYNPIDKCYVGTKVIDTIIEANNNLDEIYFICLDEMNIACVEEYFSEFLSVLYTKEKELNLYSQEIYSIERKSIDRLINLGDTEEDIINKLGIKEYCELEKKLKNLDKYTPVVKIPNNVRFIGTINRDATTKDLSPKVIDRSIIININSSFDTFKELLEMKKQSSILPIFVSSDEIQSPKGDEKKAFEIFKDLIEVFNNNNIELNFRFLSAVATMLTIEGIEKENIIDYIVATKVLPKLNNEINDEHELLGFLSNFISERKISKQIYDDMVSFYEKHGFLTYWR